MKVLYCNKYNYAFSGTESYLFEVMDLMRARGHEAALFSMADPRGELTPYDRHFIPLVNFKNLGKNPVRQARSAAHAIYSTEARRHLRGMLAEFRPDVAHVRNIYHLLSPSILWELKAQKIPVLYHLNDFKVLCPSYNMVSRGGTCERCQGGKFWHIFTEGCYPGTMSSKLLLASEAYAHRWLQTYEKCVDCFLAPSQFVKSKLVENGWSAHKIEVIPHFQSLVEAKALQTNAPILYFGRLSPEKGVSDLLWAMQRLPKLHLNIAGDGTQRAELEDLVRKLNLKNVQFLGHINRAELDACIASSCFTVFPSHAYETFGKSIVESYAHGRTVIASDLGSRRELVQAGRTGLLYPPGDVEQLTQSLTFLAEHPNKTEEMGMAAREFVRQNYSPDTHYAALNDLYRRLQRRSAIVSVPESMPPQRSALRIGFIGGRGVISKYSGIETFYEEAGQRLAAKGHEVVVYCRTHFTPPVEKYKGMRLVRLPAIRSKHLETLSHTALSTVHALWNGCDIFHYHALGPALFSFLPRLFGKKTIVTVQGLDWQRKKWGRLASSILRWGERASARFPNTTMVVSETLHRHYVEQHGIQTTYIPNGTTIRTRRKPSQIARWGIEPGQYLLFLGRFSPEKNCHLLIEAYEKLDTPVKLVLAGGSHYPDAYAKELHRHASDKIRLLNWVSGQDLEELQTNAMLFVLPSDLEGLSLALLDAMGSGVCALTSDIAENRELVDGCGFTFAHGDVNDLERMLRFLISDRDIRQAAASRAREKIRSRYLWPQVASQIDDVYQLLAGNKKDSAAVDVPPSWTVADSNERKTAA